MYNNQKIKKSYKDSNVTKMPISKNRGNRKNSGKWTIKYKKSINCRKPKGFSQKQYCKYGRKKTEKTIQKISLS